MSAALKQRITFDATTRELWRIAESGEVNELENILSRGVDIDARNEHGMTALMRAANNGNEPMVRALIRNGANPNVTRNDKFTALALAAFFGHTETVRVLIEHGAKTEVVTRFGTSPLMWAKARTFKEAVRCLETSRPVPAPIFKEAAPTFKDAARVLETPRPALAPVPLVVKEAPVVKTLSEPPEIWDLVQEVPRGFNPRSAFFARLSSMKRSYAAGVSVILLLIVAGGVGALVLRSSEARNLPAAPQPVQPAVVETTVTPPASVENSAPPAPPVTESVPAQIVNEAPVTRRSRNRFAARPNEVVEFAPVTEAPAASAVATPELEKPKPAAAAPEKTQPNTALSPHMITPAKNAAPKAKVIQWP